MSRRISNPLLTRVRQVSSPRKMVKNRLERVQKINKVSKSLFGPVIKSEFKSFAQVEMAKYQLQAANKWGFDFTTESPANNTSNFQWQSTTLSDIPKFYHHIIHNRVTPPPAPSSSSSFSSSSSSSSSLLELNGKNSEMVMSYFSECENISPLSRNISPMIIVQKPLAVNNSVVPTKVVSIASMSSNQTKITDFLKVRKRRLSTTTAVAMKKARANV
ncbi:unnamed protein product [Diamesa serratosioi]